MADIPDAMRAGVRQLAQLQRADGSFVGEHWGAGTDREPTTSIFATALVVCATQSMCRSDALDDIRRRAADFLRTHQSPHGSFNYWIRGSMGETELPCPDDLDDTACALAALTIAAPSHIDAPLMANVVKILTHVETKPGGPYRTWITTGDAADIWKDVDPVVNAHIGFFLSLHDISLPGLTIYLEDAIASNQLTSPYYPSPLSALYAIARWYQGQATETLAQRILSLRGVDGTWGSTLNNALACSALLRLGADATTINAMIEQLRLTIFGTLNAESFWVESIRGSVPRVAGSAALTLASCLEAIALFEERSTSPAPAAAPLTPHENNIVTAVRADLDAIFRRLSSPLQTRVGLVFARVTQHDRDTTLALLPTRFANALGQTEDLHVDDALLTKLGSATVLGWMAYTVFDDVLDEAADARDLPVATLCLREVTALLTAILPASYGFNALYRSIMDRIDAANAWETQTCRLLRTGQSDDWLIPKTIPHYGDLRALADRSLGHALGPLAVLLARGSHPSSADIQATLTGFTHYLIARQLDDDVHDWEDDLLRGQVNAVGAQLLNTWRTTHADETATVGTIIPELKRLLWEHDIESVCRDIADHLGQARLSFDLIPALCGSAFVDHLLVPHQTSVDNALRERAETLAFIRSYGTSR